ncbi:MAG: Outer rane receptor protein mostly Fe transport [Segetibacter sp.]|nr:Outer rane receptor protein mostly Fe transport [Segetibacter sp.]
MIRKPYKFWASLLPILFLMQVLLPFLSEAQETTSLVKGIVHGDNNEPLLGVSVVIRNDKTKFTSGASTDSAGVFTATQKRSSDEP